MGWSRVSKCEGGFSVEAGGVQGINRIACSCQFEVPIVFGARCSNVPLHLAMCLLKPGDAVGTGAVLRSYGDYDCSEHAST